MAALTSRFRLAIKGLSSLQTVVRARSAPISARVAAASLTRLSSPFTAPKFYSSESTPGEAGVVDAIKAASANESDNVFDLDEAADDIANKHKERKDDTPDNEAAEDIHSVIYIGNLPFEAVQEDVVSHLSSGASPAPKWCRLVRDSRGNSKGFGFVAYPSKEVAEAAMEEFNERMFRGRRALLRPRNGPKSPEDEQVLKQRHREHLDELSPSTVLYITNLSSEISLPDANDLIRSLPGVLNARMTVTLAEARMKAYIHVEFLDQDAADAAKEKLSDLHIFGRIPTVKYSQKRGFNADEASGSRRRSDSRNSYGSRNNSRSQFGNNKNSYNRRKGGVFKPEADSRWEL